MTDDAAFKEMFEWCTRVHSGVTPKLREAIYRKNRPDDANPLPCKESLQVQVSGKG